jgi:hypothetical protein
MKGEIRMSLANTITELEQQAYPQEEGEARDNESTGVKTPQHILQSALDALRKGSISEVLDQFADDFIFNDDALTLEFTDKLRLGEFFEKSRELFPGAGPEIVSIFEEGDQAIAQWKLSTMQIVAYGWNPSAMQNIPYDSICYRFPIFLFGATIVRVDNGKIVRWTDCHDQSSSQRMSLPAFFTEGI